MHSIDAFLLTRQWRDGPDGIELVFWAWSADGPLRLVVTGQQAVCFIPREASLPDDLSPARRRTVNLATMDGTPVDALYFHQQRDLLHFRERLGGTGIALFESDLKPADRFLMERFIHGGVNVTGHIVHRHGYRELHNPRWRPGATAPDLRFVSLDIETSDLDGVIYSMALATTDERVVFLVGAPLPGGPDYLHVVPDERALLQAAADWLNARDPDLILGWNLVNFDLDFIDRRCRELGIAFHIGRDGSPMQVLPPLNDGQSRTARIAGRLALDGIDCLRMATWTFESFELDAVAHAMLGRGKLIEEEDRLGAIRRLYREDPAGLAAYNLEDAQLVIEIFARADLIPFLVQRSRMTGLAPDRAGGSVAAFDHLYLPRLHRAGYVAPDTGSHPNPVHSPGGFVMDSEPGLYDNVLVLDFKSLYPSIIRSFNIDPLGLARGDADGIPGFLGARFSREAAILPQLIEQLWAARDAAKQDANAPLSQAIKILMNSFYGVLGSFGCRFFDPRLASSITRRGHQIINESREQIEARGLRVIYGDTDSVFVLLGPGMSENEARATGEALAVDLNTWWTSRLADEFGIESRLEIEFETHYLRFLMPTVRGADKGSKKRYAGYVRDGEGYRLVFKGLESVRTDWTRLARDFQHELYRRVFFDEPYEAFVRETVANLHAGQLDDQLVYRKRLRRRLDDYQRNVPPHVQAARKLPRVGKAIEYVITLNGPEPASQVASALDYGHYEERQLKPVADGILYFLGTSFDEVLQRQISMF
jgi:DNA polymerase-2